MDPTRNVSPRRQPQKKKVGNSLKQKYECAWVWTCVCNTRSLSEKRSATHLQAIILASTVSCFFLCTYLPFFFWGGGGGLLAFSLTITGSS
jgi:uncharacterized membrane protein YozB (DUF420 family)